VSTARLPHVEREYCRGPAAGGPSSSSSTPSPPPACFPADQGSSWGSGSCWVQFKGKKLLRSAYRSAELLSAWPLHAGRALDQLHALYRNQLVLNRRRGPRRRRSDLK
jgi:hypothetical protein